MFYWIRRVLGYDFILSVIIGSCMLDFGLVVVDFLIGEIIVFRVLLFFKFYIIGKFGGVGLRLERCFSD